jgi:hypothetical protein
MKGVFYGADPTLYNGKPWSARISSRRIELVVEESQAVTEKVFQWKKGSGKDLWQVIVIYCNYE